MPEKENNTFQSAAGYLLWGIGALGTIVTFVKGYRESSDLYWLGGHIVLAIGLGCLYFIIDK
ncbi:MAG: hypothetical protein MN733_23125, partial [Nitrososphaera sp.]|nr:hypothetical protein [Nitrososphaera sp.]